MENKHPPITIVTTSHLDSEFSSLQSSVCSILNRLPGQEEKLKECKDFCLFHAKKISKELLCDGLISNDKINNCTNFKELLLLFEDNMSWEEYSIMERIVDKCKSDKALDEIKKFEHKVALIEGLQLVYDKDNVEPKGFRKFLLIIKTHYKDISPKQFKTIRNYIVKTLKIKSYMLTRYMKFHFNSLHIEWLVIVQAIPYMIKMAHQNKEMFINEKFVFMKIGSEIIIDQVFF